MVMQGTWTYIAYMKYTQYVNKYIKHFLIQIDHFDLVILKAAQKPKKYEQPCIKHKDL